MSSYNFPQDDYALAILTQAAMHTTSASHASHNNSAYDPAVQNSASSKPHTRGPSTPSITNSPNGPLNLSVNNNQDPLVPHSRNLDSLSSFAASGPSTRNMETLAFDSANGSRSNPYIGFRGIGSQISTNYASSLGILNAESYDDGRLSSIQEARHMRSRNGQQNVMPFGITGSNIGSKMDLETRTSGEEAGKLSKRKKRGRRDSHNADDEEEARKKARGRPRVDTKDETAADRRRTQIRMAQRAYRHRKETTITSLEKKVQDLRGTNEEMSNIFISLYDFAVSKGLLQREPEFGQQLQSTTERFLALAKATVNDDGSQEEHSVDDNGKPETSKSDSHSSHGGTGEMEAPKKFDGEIIQNSLPSQPWGGYTVTAGESPVEEIQLDFPQSYEHRTRQGDLQVITRPTEDNASFPFDFMDFQQYRVEVPPVEDYLQAFLPYPQPSLPDTYSYEEHSFARRIQRGAAERGYKLITLENPPKQRLQEVFGFCLLYESKESIIARLERVMRASSKESLQQWRAPFVHAGGSGTFYPVHESNVNEELMPKLRTGYSMGPFPSSVAPAQDVIKDNMRITLPGFEGEFFDPNDVEGYLRGRGLEIPPAADYVTVELDFSTLADIGTPKSNLSESTAPTLSPKTPISPIDPILMDNKNSSSHDFCNPSGKNWKSFPFPLGFANWESALSSSKEMNNIDPIFKTIQDQSSERISDLQTASSGEKRMVTVNVQTLLDEILDHAVCLGRAPGFRPSDVNAAIIAAVRTGFDSSAK